MGGHPSRPFNGDSATPSGDLGASAGDSADAALPLAIDKHSRKLIELCTSSSSTAPTGGCSTPPARQAVGGSHADLVHEEGTWDVQALKDSVCRLTVRRSDGVITMGTGWVVRNDDVAALLMARHVLHDSVGGEDGGAERVLVGQMSATFFGGKMVDLSDARALLAPKSPGDGASEQPDVAVVVRPAGQSFPARPVPCRLDTACASDIGGDGHCSLLHHPDASTHVVLESRWQLDAGESSVSSVPRSWWEVRYRANSKRGSSGGMLVDANGLGALVRDGLGSRGRGGQYLADVHGFR